MTPTRRGWIVPALLLAVLSGCAAITTSPNQTITVTTDPAGATCSLKRRVTALRMVEAEKVNERITNLCDPADCERQLNVAGQEETLGLERIGFSGRWRASRESSRRTSNRGTLSRGEDE
jgi:serine protease inhibitor ecotin